VAPAVAQTVTSVSAVHALTHTPPLVYATSVVYDAIYRCTKVDLHLRHSSFLPETQLPAFVSLQSLPQVAYTVEINKVAIILLIFYVYYKV
jgi:hypothetical protein